MNVSRLMAEYEKNACCAVFNDALWTACNNHMICMTAIKLHSSPPALRLICGLFNDNAISSDSIMLNDRLPGDEKIGKNAKKTVVV